MSGPDAQVVRQLEDPRRGVVETARGGLHFARVSRGGFEEVGTAEIADEDEVARYHAHGFGGAAPAVGDHEADVLGSVAGSVHRPDIDPAYDEAVPVAQQGDPVAVLRPLVLPVRSALRRKVGAAPVALGEFKASREEIGVNVGFRHGRDPESLSSCDRHVAVDVALRVDDDRLARALAPYEVGVLCQLVVDDLSEEHVFPNGPAAPSVVNPERATYGAFPEDAVWSHST